MSNLKFALSVDSENPDLQAMAQEIRRLRQENQPTVPSILAQELACNPFLRVDDADFRKRHGWGLDAPGSKVFGDMRQRKDVFKPPASL
mmetsp:Transcript_6477/g.13781  ORF Transcript_6477/g.13781 Transcript_6477/m.13781 type:complete len:89 (+) Transcript_6477:559-825(+)|eukprot:CAMPEP_0204295874 /NCGR_PEP_ID=MMETSP0468-20130131/70471_1 /ASSEMBLY_ACC=CAM_ASM_000383 /TAXON_ID=2969 /ORGANISM="Oxyrrhis marina" /LENGTH=88 /DNA_ID=CAMNT_0051274535 /DNA_START=82 /DNA_END=348 /DNA_ORIENTATION=-